MLSIKNPGYTTRAIHIKLNKKLYKYLSKIGFMASKVLRCSSCNVSVSNTPGSVRFLCPQCGKEEIVRCKHCRKISARYTCSCGLTGPN